jgi:regulator of nonsense transcripts 1
MVFIKCSEPEDLGSKSKSNRGQALLCQVVCKMLCTAPDTAQSPLKQSLVVLTPYTRQITLLEKLLSGIEVSSIDGFQGREADVIVFVTVRCNQRKEMGFLKDMRRLNVAATRARAALIVIGDATTLAEGNDEESAAVWRRLISSCAVVEQNLFNKSEPEASSQLPRKS